MGVLLVGGSYFEVESLQLDRRLAAGVAEGFYADLIFGKDRLIERKDELLREAETLVLAKDSLIQQAEAQNAGLRSALDQVEAELARIKSSRSWRLVSRLSRLRGLTGRRRARSAQAS
jgi:hypothetical protein